MRLVSYAFLIAACAASTGSAADDHHAGHDGPAHAAAPATRPAAAGVVSLDVYADGTRVHVLTVTREDGPVRLQHARSDDGGATFGAPVELPLGAAPPEGKRGADVQIAAAGDRVVAAWTAHSVADRFGRGPLVTAISGDGGRTWRAGANPVDDPADTGRAFVDVAAGDDGTFHLVWLDGRPTPGTPPKGKGLRYARSADGGQTWSINQTLAAATCECCWNTVTTAPGGRVAVLFRQKDPRDMGVVSSADGGLTWGTAVTVGAFGWAVDGCPHVGGGLAFAPPDPLDLTGDGAAATAAHAVVWTAKGDGATGAYVLSSADAGRTWSPPAQLGGDARSWHADVATAPGGRVAAVWDAHDGARQAAFATQSNDGGRTWSAPVALSGGAASATHPRVVWAGTSFRAFWTERAGPTAPSRVASRKL